MSILSFFLPKRTPAGTPPGAGAGAPAAAPRRPLLNRLAGPFTWALILLVLWVPLLVLVYFLWPRPAVATNQLVYSGPALVFRIQDVGELTTLRYQIQKIVTARQKDLELLGVPIATEKLTLIAQLTADFRYDLTQVKPEDVTVTGAAPNQIVRVKLPPPSLVVGLDTQRTVVYEHSIDFTKRLFNAADPQFETWLRRAAEEETKVALKNSEDPSRARENAEALLLGLFRSLGVSEVHIDTQSRGPADRVRFVTPATAAPERAPAAGVGGARSDQ